MNADMQLHQALRAPSKITMLAHTTLSNTNHQSYGATCLEETIVDQAYLMNDIRRFQLNSS